MRQSRAHRTRNRAQRTTLRTAVRRVRAATTKAEAQAAYKAAEVLLDRAARKGLIHRNNAARNKERLWKALAKLK
jgi:small subunit ribosomal protein S20